jgi:hypothetical protein
MDHLTRRNDFITVSRLARFDNARPNDRAVPADPPGPARSSDLQHPHDGLTSFVNSMLST